MSNLQPKRLRLDVGIFAHNKAGEVEATLRDLIGQDLLKKHDVRIVPLVNGCTDDTPLIVDQFAALNSDVYPIHYTLGGKSRTWNRFVHDDCRSNCDYLIFCDADIRLPTSDILTRLLTAHLENPDLHAVNSHPVKDLVYAQRRLTPVERLIAASAETSNDWREAICGQLYLMPIAAARRYLMPIGLPVEDGFLHAAILTDNFRNRPDKNRVAGSDAFHVYESERTILSLIRHQTRIIIGSAINEALFRKLQSGDGTDAFKTLKEAASDPAWLGAFLRTALPRWPYGYVSTHFLLKRTARSLRNPKQLLRPKRMLTFVAGAAFDFLVYILAQWRMARGTGAGFW